MPWSMMDPEAVVLLIASSILYMLGLISGLILPHLLQGIGAMFQPMDMEADRESEGLEATPQATLELLSRPLSDIEPETLTDITPHWASTNQDHHFLQHSTSGRVLSAHVLQQLLSNATPSGLSPHWEVTEADLQRFRHTVQPVESRLLTGDLASDGWSHIM